MFDSLKDMQIKRQAQDNAITYTATFERLKMLALSVYQWKNLPDSMSERCLEEWLFSDGQCCAIEDENYGIINLRCTASNKLNIYYEPIQYTCYSVDYSRQVMRHKLAHCRNNASMIPTCFFIQHFVQKLQEVEQNMIANVNQQKFSAIWGTDEKTRLSVKNILQKIDMHEPVILTTGKMAGQIEENLKVFNSNIPFVADKLDMIYNAIWNDCIRFLGIQSQSFDKKERLNAEEVVASNDVVDLNVANGLFYRKEFCKELNDKFGLNVDVSLRKYADEDLYIRLLENKDQQEEEQFFEYEEEGDY